MCLVRLWLLRHKDNTFTTRQDTTRRHREASRPPSFLSTTRMSIGIEVSHMSCMQTHNTVNPVKPGGRAAATIKHKATATSSTIRSSLLSPFCSGSTQQSKAFSGRPRCQHLSTDPLRRESVPLQCLLTTRSGTNNGMNVFRTPVTPRALYVSPLCTLCTWTASLG